LIALGLDCEITAVRCAACAAGVCPVIALRTLSVDILNRLQLVHVKASALLFVGECSAPQSLSDVVRIRGEAAAVQSRPQWWLVMTNPATKTKRRRTVW